MKKFFSKIGHFFAAIGKGVYRAEPALMVVAEKLDPRDANKLAMAQSVLAGIKGETS